MKSICISYIKMSIEFGPHVAIEDANRTLVTLQSLQSKASTVEEIRIGYLISGVRLAIEEILKEESILVDFVKGSQGQVDRVDLHRLFPNQTNNFFRALTGIA